MQSCQCLLFQDGLFHVEDLAAQWSAKILDVKPGHRVLDVCAAPGGKSFSLAEYAENRGEVCAFDLYDSRVGLISSGADRLGLDSVIAKQADATVFNQALGEFDRVLCDVPCSGFGIMRRKPDIKYKDKEDLSKLSQLQLDIISTASKYLKSGGKLVYSTCTLRKEENIDVVERFLQGHPDFKPFVCNISDTKYWHKTFLPQKDLTDGFFAAVLIKE